MSQALLFRLAFSSLLTVVMAHRLPAAAPATRPAATQPSLSDSDKKYLDSLLTEFLFDPLGAERVTVNIVVRTVWTRSEQAPVGAWLASAPDGKPDRVYFTDGYSIPAPRDKEIKKIDFVAAAQARYAPATQPAAHDQSDDLDSQQVFVRMRLTALGQVTEDNLAMAAWLHRLGRDDLAAAALAAARAPQDDPRQALRHELAWSAYAAMVHAYMVRADDDACAYGQHLLRVYPAECRARDFADAPKIVAELQRRRAKGTFGKAPPDKFPDGFDAWNAARKTAWLIDSLDEVDARQFSQPGGVDLSEDRRVDALIRIGDPAVPALLDTLEKDQRLTRSVHFWRDFSPSRTVLGVREAALTAIMSILRVQVFEPVSTGDNFTARGEDEAQKVVARLRAYWKEYGPLPFDERMMKVLTNPKTTFEAKREAAGNLATLTEDHRLGTTVWTNSIRSEAKSQLNPAIAKFSNPTAAQAILTAMDADLAAYDAKPRDTLYDYNRRGLEDQYLFALLGLDDRRIVGEVVRRCSAAPTVRTRRKWAYAAHKLGDSQPLKVYAADFAAGKIKLPANDQPQTNDNDQPGNVELLGIVSYLADAGLAETDRALNALADPKHPLYPLACQRVLKESVDWSDSRAWFVHPYCLSILRRQLDNSQPTGAVYRIDHDRLISETHDGSSSGGIPDFLADPAVRRDRAAERTCDVAAAKLGELVVGLPPYHALLKNADERLNAMKNILDHFAGRYRLATAREVETLGLSSFNPVFIPDLPPLGRAATSADVYGGRAVFQLDGKGMPADLQPPAAAQWKHDQGKAHPASVLIVQAEIAPDGSVVYGVITPNEIRAVPARELTNVKTLVQIEKEARKQAPQGAKD